MIFAFVLSSSGLAGLSLLGGRWAAVAALRITSTP